MPLTPLPFLLLALCAVMVGMAKTGVPGLGILVVPIIASLEPSAIAGTGLLLPLLISADLVAVVIYRRQASANTLWHLLPWVALGLIGGFLAMKRMDDVVMRMIIGLIVLGMVVLHLSRAKLQEAAAPNWRRAAFYGIVAGFATMVANAAGPVMSLYLLSMALPKDEFMGTGAWFFLLINCIKVPFYLGLSPPIINHASLILDASVLPAVWLGAFGGRWIYARMPQQIFDRVVVAMTVLSALVYLRPALASLLQRH